jgi:hypothetical protein
VVLAVAERFDEARAVLRQYDVTPERLMLEPFPACGPMQLASMAYHADEPELAESVARTLRPYRRYWAHFYLAAFAPVAWGLALCEWTMGNFDLAAELFDEAETRLDEAGAIGLVPIVSSYHARMLVERGAPQDAKRARDLLDRAMRGAALIDAPVMVQKCTELLSQLSS